MELRQMIEHVVAERQRVDPRNLGSDIGYTNVDVLSRAQLRLMEACKDVIAAGAMSDDDGNEGSEQLPHASLQDLLSALDKMMMAHSQIGRAILMASEPSPMRTGCR